MIYEDVIREFATRTRANLLAIRKLEEEGHPDVYEVTQLVNSMLGLLVFPREQYLEAIPAIPLEELRPQGWPSPVVSDNFEPPDDLRELIRYLRNAIAHFNIKFRPGPHGEITGLEVWNRPSRSMPENWKAYLSVEDLEVIATRFTELLLD